MTTAQPGQEQRMVTDAMRFAARQTGDTASEMPDWAIDAIYAAMHAARPTADLGEGGEMGRDLRDWAQAMRPLWSEESYAKVIEAADRLILYREALEEAVAALGQVNVRCFDREASPLKPLGDIAREALASICKKLGDAAYDDIARAVLSRSGG